MKDGLITDDDMEAIVKGDEDVFKEVVETIYVAMLDKLGEGVNG
jgi:hypothetical protein